MLKDIFYLAFFFKIPDMKTIHLILLIFITAFFNGHIFCQDPNFSQLSSNKIYYNPAFVGAREGLEINLNFRKSWMNIPGSPQTTIAVFDKSFWNIKGIGGIGLMLMNNIEGAGSLSTLSLGIPISTRVRLTEKLLVQLAISPQYQMKRINWDRLTFYDQLDPYFGKVLTQSPGFQYDTENTDSFFDLSYGILFVYESYPGKRNEAWNSIVKAGLAVHHLPEPTMSFLGMEYFLSSKFVVHVDGIFPLKKGYYRRDNYFLMPGFIYESQGALNSMLIGLNFKRNPITGGIWLRNKNLNPSNATDLIFLFGYQFPINNDGSSRVTVYYSYDATVSDLNNHESGSHEIGITTNLDNFYIFNKCESCKDDKWLIGK